MIFRFFFRGALIPVLCLSGFGHGRFHAVALQEQPAVSRSAERPNILVVLVDDMGVMDSSVPFLTDADGNPQRYPLNDRYRTPNLARLAEQGVRFSSFLAMSVCSPTRMALLTGQTSARHRTTNWIHPARNNRGEFGPRAWNWSGMTRDQISLPRLLQAAGYHTIQCGKGHLGPFDSVGADPRSAGFDISIGGSAMGQPGSYFGTASFGNQASGPTPQGVPGLAKYHGQEIFLTDALTRELKPAIAGAVGAGQPFFAFFSHYAVHAPFQPDPRFIDHYSGEPRDFAAFAALIEGMDHSLGEMLDHLDRLGVAEETLVFFLGDNGTDAPLGDPNAILCAAPLRGKKGTHYEGGMRTAFVAAWAKPNPAHPLQKRIPVQPGTSTSQLAAVYDLFPTLLAAADCPPADCPPADPHPVDGINLLPRFAAPSSPLSDRTFLMHFPHDHRSSWFTVLRQQDWKLIYHWRRAAENRVELFHLATDPSESTNRAADSPEQTRRMLIALRDELEKTGALPPLADDRQTPLEVIIPPS